jgi:hypothetical protein
MAIKMRILHYTGKAKLRSIGDVIKSEYDLAINSVDAIPPAYPCNNERIVILVLSVKDDADDQLRRFLMELTKARAQNVAIVTDSKPAGIEKVIGYLKQAGTNVVGEPLNIAAGLFAGKNLSDDEKAKVLDWVKSIVDSLN